MFHTRSSTADKLLPVDVKLGTGTAQLRRDILSASDFAEELKLKLQKTYETVDSNMCKYRERMSNTYNKAIRVHEYSVGDKVWLVIKRVKKGLSPKLAPRRSGPWTILEVYPN